MAGTEGEKIIEYFLNDEGIRFKREYEIPSLKGDYRSFRRADFFLPKYKVCVEFLGKWADQKSREGYNQKKEIYRQNSIPCVYIYPDNLGTLKYLFYMRLEEELRRYSKLKRQLFKYKLLRCSRMLVSVWSSYFLLSVFILLLANLLQTDLSVTPGIALLLLLLFFIAVYLTLYTIKASFFEKITKN